MTGAGAHSTRASHSCQVKQKSVRSASSEVSQHGESDTRASSRSRSRAAAAAGSLVVSGTGRSSASPSPSAFGEEEADNVFRSMLRSDSNASREVRAPPRPHPKQQHIKGGKPRSGYAPALSRKEPSLEVLPTSSLASCALSPTNQSRPEATSQPALRQRVASRAAAVRRRPTRPEWNSDIDLSSEVPVASSLNQLPPAPFSNPTAQGRVASNVASRQRRRVASDTDPSLEISGDSSRANNSPVTRVPVCQSPQLSCVQEKTCVARTVSTPRDHRMIDSGAETQEDSMLQCSVCCDHEAPVEAEGDIETTSAIHCCDHEALTKAIGEAESSGAACACSMSKSSWFCSLPSFSALLPTDVEPTADVIQHELRFQADTCCIPQGEGKQQTADLRVWMAALAQQEQKLQQLKNQSQHEKLKSAELDEQISNLEKGLEKLDKERAQVEEEREKLKKQSEALKWFRDEEVQKQRCTLEAQFQKEKGELLQKLEDLQKEKEGFVQMGQVLLEKGDELAEERRQLQKERNEIRETSEKAQQMLVQREAQLESKVQALQQEKDTIECREQEVSNLLELVMEESQKNDIKKRKDELDQKQKELDFRQAELEHQVEQKAKCLEEQMMKVSKPPWFWANQNLAVNRINKVFLVMGQHDILSWLIASAIHDQCDGRDGSFRANHVRGVRVWRVENTLLWKQYAAKAEELHFRHQLQNKQCTPVRPPVSQPCSVTSIDESPLSWSHDKSLNEVLLWHGTKSSNIDLIAQTGFDERVCQLSGMFGAGLYFAQDSCKAGQYAQRDHKGSHWFFLSRVLLGCPYYAKHALRDIRKPPNDYDSIVYEPGPQAAVGHHRELIVYDRYQAYPEYIVEAYTT